MKKILTFVLIKILLVNVLLFGSEIVHKKLNYKIPKSLSKIQNGEFISEIIEIPIENPEPFVAIAFSFKKLETNEHQHFHIRTSKDKLNWDEWIEIEEDHHGEIEEEKSFGQLSFYDKNSKYFQIKSEELNQLDNIDFIFISPGKSDEEKIKKSLAQNKLNKASGFIERPAYVNRKAWGCPQDENVSSRTLTNVTHLVIHHSAGSTTSNDFAAVVRGYWDYHVNGRGWSDIGYNWLVDGNGILYKGRAWKSETEENVQGAHAAGANGNTAGLCYIGNYEVATPAQAGLNTLENMLAFLSDKYEIKPLEKNYLASVGSIKDNITGHGLSGSTTATACPGKNIIKILGQIREETFNKIVDTTAAPQVIVITPTDEIDSVYLSKDIIIKFSHEMDTASVENSFTITPNHQGKITWTNSNRTLNYSPVTNFLGRTNYSVTISNTAKTKWDIALTEQFIFNFTTKANNFLSIISNYPTDGAKDISPDAFIEFIFDSPLDAYSVGSNFSLTDQEGNTPLISVNNSKFSEGLIKFRAALKENTVYELIFKDSLKSVDKFPLGINKKITFTTSIKTSIKEEPEIPNDYELITAYPNPFNPVTNLQVNLKKESNVQIKIYDIMGNLVKNLVNKKMKSGIHNIKFDASSFTSGVYFSQIITDKDVKTIKLLLTK